MNVKKRYYNPKIINISFKYVSWILQPSFWSDNGILTIKIQHIFSKYGTIILKWSLGRFLNNLNPTSVTWFGVIWPLALVFTEPIFTKTSRFNTWFAVGILRFQKWFDVDVSGYQIMYWCRYLDIFGYSFQKLGAILFNSLVTLIPPEDLEITGSSLIRLLFIPSSKSDNSTSSDKKVFNHSFHQKQKQ